MRLSTPLFICLSVLSSYVAADADVPKQKHNYQSDVARMRKIVINSLYSHKEIFLRELISNANDAIEKLRLTALVDKAVWNGGDPLNITIVPISGEAATDGRGPRLIISDTGIGMTPEELTKNLGTLAKSGTSEFLAKAEGGSNDGTSTGNLIGAFGLGFYSSFLVADKVQVASIAPKTAANPNPVQHIFSSAADESEFEIYADPRGNTLGRGTEITLFLNDDSLDYLDTEIISGLIAKHSAHSTSFPMYLQTKTSIEVPDEDEEATTVDTSDEVEDEDEPLSDDEALVEDVDEDEDDEEEISVPKTKTIEVEKWSHVNPALPLWAQDQKDIEDAEFKMFYKSFFKDFNSDPVAWQHFTGDSGDGVSFKALLFLPGKLDDAYWQQPLAYQAKDVKLLVKHVFITNDLGEDALPKWASWVKVVIDADDLPLNVSRETLQSNRFLKQMRGIILRRLIQLLTRLAEEEPEKFAKIQENYGTVLKMGAIEDVKNREKLLPLARFNTNQRNSISLDQYLETRKQGQKQIFYLAEMGKTTEAIGKSVFVEKLNARGYEVLLMNEPLDEILAQNIKKYKNVVFQDIAKVGLKFGDEDSAAEEKAQLKEDKETYEPLVKYLKEQAKDLVRDVVISSRLVTSACAIVADSYGYTANVQRMMSASNAKSQENDFMHEFAMKARLLEINPRSPLIEGLLHRVEALPSPEDEEERDVEAEEELKEVVSILIDGALVRSGFEVPDTNEFFTRVDRVLRRSLGVNEQAPTDTTVIPAPPVDNSEVTEDEEENAEDWPEWKSLVDNPGPRVTVNGNSGGPVKILDNIQDKMRIEVEEIDEFGNVVHDDAKVKHDEL